MIKLTVVVAGLLFWTQGMVAQERSQEAGKPENHVTTDPEQAKIVTSDIALFWRQYDSAAQMGLDAAMDDYLKNGSYGLQQFTLLRIHSASNLAAVIRRHPKYTPRFGRALRRSPRCRGRSEGSADFIGEMIVGKIINDHLRAYADPHERELWLEFKQQMDGKDSSHWLYQGDKAKDRPADLGYYVGYKICESYYRQAADKAAAIKDILRIRDFKQFLRASQYESRFNNAARGHPAPTGIVL